MDTTKIRIGIFMVAIFCVVATPVNADWNLTDTYKMHSPQLPDPNGWDVANYNMTTGEPLLLADDWLCTETGYVTDIHIWGSWKNDSKGEIVSFIVSIWSNDPGTNFSHPGGKYWEHTFSGSEITEVYEGSGNQGWWEIRSDPQVLIINTQTNNHNDTWQYNLHIDNLSEAWVQTAGTTYWLAIVPFVNNSRYQFGWKTSYVEWQDKFVAQALRDSPDSEGMWLNMYERPRGANESLAFVINGPPLPEPPAPAPEVPAFTPAGIIALVSLLSAIAAVAIVRKRR